MEELISLPFMAHGMHKHIIIIYNNIMHETVTSLFNPLYTIVPKGIQPLNYDNRAFQHAVYKPRFFRASKFST